MFLSANRLKLIAVVFTTMLSMSAATRGGTADSAHASRSADPQARLLQAINQRDLAEATAALDAGADPNLPGDFARTPLHAAASESADIVQLLLERGARPNPLDDDGRTPLHRATTGSAQALLDHQADFLILDKNGNTALHTAAEESAATCRLLVEAGVPVDARNNAGLSPLHFAALQAEEGAAEYLLGRGADVNAKTLAPYSYKWTYVAWDVHGMEVLVPAGATPLSIAQREHERTKWSSGKYAGFVDFLRAHGAIDQKPAALPALALAAPLMFVAFFWLLFRADAYLRDWTTLAQQFAATRTPETVHSNQDGSVGRVGTIQVRRMLRAAATSEGLYVAMPSWVIAAHPPLQIPWSQLRIESCSQGIAGTRIQLSVATVSAPIFLNDGIADQVLNRIDPSRKCKGES